jgi:hypothetical protein
VRVRLVLLTVLAHKEVTLFFLPLQQQGAAMAALNLAQAVEMLALAALVVVLEVAAIPLARVQHHKAIQAAVAQAALVMLALAVVVLVRRQQI